MCRLISTIILWLICELPVEDFPKYLTNFKGCNLFLVSMTHPERRHFAMPQQLVTIQSIDSRSSAKPQCFAMQVHGLLTI
jgi:hypothetical protein